MTTCSTWSALRSACSRSDGGDSCPCLAMTAWARGSGEGRLPRQHLVQHAAQAVDVGPPVQLLVAGRLFRTHVERRPQREPGAR